jgi:signal transduction histidine kinase/DNA-binding response OmpR family regulator
LGAEVTPRTVQKFLSQFQLDNNRGSFVLTGSLSLAVCIGLIMIIVRLRRDAAKLEQHTTALESEIAERRRVEEEVRQSETRLRKLNQQLALTRDQALEANRAKSTFLANMSHELRTPLNAIIGYSEMLQEEAQDLDAAKSFIPDLQKIHSAGKHLLTLINDVLDLSKVEAGKMDLYLETFDLPALAEEVRSTVQPMVDKNQNKLTILCPPDLGTMHADLTRVRQCLLNLLSNAAKFTVKDSISLEVKRKNVADKEWIQFRVRDSGIGMTPEQLGRLFQAFSQADASTTRKYGGTGLGLAISRRFCQMMGGEISAESESGIGSTFTIRLPANVISRESGPAQQEPEPAPPEDAFASVSADLKDVLGKRDTVLVVDDDPAVRDMLKRYLSKEGFHVVTASSGPEGLRLAKEAHPQAITLDVMMPGMDGWAVLSALKADATLADIAVVMLSIVDEKNLGFALGASDYLTKPLDRERLRNILSRHCRTKSPGSALVVDDDAAAREVLRRLLERDGWKVLEAVNGQHGLERVKENPPEVILLDLMMPVMDGFEFVSQLRQSEEGRRIPVVVITAKELTAEDHARLRGQASSLLHKGSYSREELLREVSRLLKGSERVVEPG